MPIPDHTPNGLLPPGIHAASLKEVLARYGDGNVRQRQCHLLQLIVEAATNYPTIKRVLVWGSFVTTKAEPNDLDYSIVVSTEHPLTEIAEAHRRFFVPVVARQFYGADRGYLLIRDYPLEVYIELTDFISHRKGIPCGVIEISLRGEVIGG